MKLERVFPPTPTVSFPTAAWRCTLYGQPLALQAELVYICSQHEQHCGRRPCSSPWVVALGTGRENRFSNQSSHEARKNKASMTPTCIYTMMRAEGPPLVPQQTVPGECKEQSSTQRALRLGTQIHIPALSPTSHMTLGKPTSHTSSLTL